MQEDYMCRLNGWVAMVWMGEGWIARWDFGCTYTLQVACG